MATKAELWRVQKAGRELRALTLRFDHGVDLQLREGDDLRRSHLCRDGTDAAVALAADWLTKLTAAGWLPCSCP